MQTLHDISCSIRQFGIGDLAVYKAMRLEALQTEPGMFGNSYAMEAAFAEADWMKRVSSENSAVFGLYCGDELAGITGIVINTERPDEAYMTQSYIRIAHRGKGLSRMLYEARLGWAKEKNIKRLVIGHRERNTISKSANQRYGFKYTHRENRTWPDGETEDMVYYELLL
jgi:RimJ/RimL family protein N-acetyltransferase